MTSPATAARRLIAGAALACITALVTACASSGSGTAAPTVTVTTTSPPAAGSTATVPAATSPATATAPAGPAACPTSALQVKKGLAQGAAGSIYAAIDFVNISSVTCSLYGYPGVSFVTARSGGSQIGLAATESTTTPRRLVTLAPGATGNALLRIVQAGNYPASKCRPVTAHWLRIYPPNQTTPAYLAYTAQTCSKPVNILSVSVVQPGSGG
jgi:Protein of unknown function (DUF4232)